MPRQTGNKPRPARYPGRRQSHHRGNIPRPRAQTECAVQWAMPCACRPARGKQPDCRALYNAQTDPQSRHKNEPPRGEVRNVSGKSGGGEDPLTRALRSIPRPMRPHWRRFHDWRSAAAIKIIFCGARRMPLRTTRELPQQRRARGQRRIRTTRRSLSRILRFSRPYPPP